MPGPKQAWATFVYVLTKCMLLTTNYSWNGLFLLLQQRRKSPNLHLIQISFTTLTTIVNSYINDTSPCINLSWVHRKRLWWVLLGNTEVVTRTQRSFFKRPSDKLAGSISLTFLYPNSVTRLLDYCSTFGHLHQRKFAQKNTKLANVGSKFCQIVN